MAERGSSILFYDRCPAAGPLPPSHPQQPWPCNIPSPGKPAESNRGPRAALYALMILRGTLITSPPSRLTSAGVSTTAAPRHRPDGPAGIGGSCEILGFESCCPTFLAGPHTLPAGTARPRGHRTDAAYERLLSQNHAKRIAPEPTGDRQQGKKRREQHEMQRTLLPRLRPRHGVHRAPSCEFLLPISCSSELTSGRWGFNPALPLRALDILTMSMTPATSDFWNGFESA